MRFFPILRTRRLTVQLRELSIGQSIKLAAIPLHLQEFSTSEFLKYAVDSVSGIENIADWTCQERLLCIAHYLASVTEDGPDFSLGKGKYSDYLDGSKDIDKDFKPLLLGEIGGDTWSITHLTGRMVDAIERLSGELSDIPPRLHWLLGGMVAQLVRQGEELPELSTEGQYDEWLLNGMRVFAAFPESSFEALIILYQSGREQLTHLFNIEFDDEGIITLPKKGADGSLPPARFPVRTCLSKLSLELVR